MSQINQRLVFRNAVKSMVKAGVNPASAVLSQSYLRLERLASSTVTNYQFGVLSNDVPQGSSVRTNEQRLSLQDSFFVSSIQMFISLASSSTTTSYTPMSYPNPHVFTDAGAATALMNLYNSNISLTVNNRTIATSWDTLRHYEVPQTQQTAINNTTAGNASDMLSGGFSASYAVEPNWVLIGSKNNVLQINLPSAIGTLQTTSSPSTVIILMLRGVLAQNSTSVN